MTRYRIKEEEMKKMLAPRYKTSPEKIRIERDPINGDFLIKVDDGKDKGLDLGGLFG